MVIHWKNSRLQKDLENQKYLQQRLGQKWFISVVRRLSEIKAANNYTEIPISSGKHVLHSNKLSNLPFYAVDIPTWPDGRGKMRIIFQPHNSDFDKNDLKTMQEILIVELSDYH